jgi:hypothetical protein
VGGYRYPRLPIIPLGAGWGAEVCYVTLRTCIPPPLPSEVRYITLGTWTLLFINLSRPNLILHRKSNANFRVYKNVKTRYLYCTSVCERPQSSPQFCSASVIFSLYKVYSTSLLNICAVKCALSTDLVKSTVPLFDFIFGTVHILFQTLPEKRKGKFSESDENWTASTHNLEKVFREKAFRKQTGQGTAVKGLSVQENPGEIQSSKNWFFSSSQYCEIKPSCG